MTLKVPVLLVTKKPSAKSADKIMITSLFISNFLGEKSMDNCIHTEVYIFNTTGAGWVLATLDASIRWRGDLQSTIQLCTTYLTSSSDLIFIPIENFECRNKDAEGTFQKKRENIHPFKYVHINFN